MKGLLVYLKDYKKESILGPLFKLLEASFELIVPLVVASMIDVGIENGDKGYVIRMCLLMAALGLTGLISSVTAQFFAAKAAVGFATKQPPVVRRRKTPLGGRFVVYRKGFWHQQSYLCNTPGPLPCRAPGERAIDGPETPTMRAAPPPKADI